jgi:hypothetical protein
LTRSRTRFLSRLPAREGAGRVFVAGGAAEDAISGPAGLTAWAVLPGIAVLPGLAALAGVVLGRRVVGLIGSSGRLERRARGPLTLDSF